MKDGKIIDITHDKDTDLEPADDVSNAIVNGCLFISALVVGIIIGAICYAWLVPH
jgi:hypothetical protein